jgi:carboxylate-amine ligase
MRDPSFTLGIEEEYLVVDRQSRDLVIDPPPGLMEACEKATDGRVSPEFLGSQVEAATGVCRSVEQAAREMQQLRRAIAGVAEGYGLGIIADFLLEETLAGT